MSNPTLGELNARLNRERELIRDKLVNTYKLPIPLASAIAKAHQLGGGIYRFLI